MKGKFLKHKQNYYRRINHLMNRINLKLSLENENESLKNEIKIEEKKTQKKCSICNKNEVKYICPKCKIPYCSMDCYKKHNKECTEEFYKNNVIEELKSMKFKEEETKIFKEKLKNYQEKLNKIDEKYEEIKDEENNKIKNKEIERYEEILNKMNNDKFNAKYDFTSEDWTNFHNFMKTFQNIEIFKIYKPYWTREPKSLLVFDKAYYESFSEDDINNLKNLDINAFYSYIDENDDNENDNAEEKELDLDLEIDDEKNYICLKGEKKLIDENIINDSIIIRYQNIKQLNFQNANNKNIFQIIYIIILNTYIYRLFNGIVDEDDNIKDVYNHIIYLSPLLYNKKEKIPENVSESFNIFIEKLKKLEKNKDNLNKIEKLLLNDTIDLLKNHKFFIYESLLRLYDIIHKYSMRVDIEKNDKNKCTAAKYKLIYFMSYLKYQIKESDIDNILDNLILKKK